MVETGGYTGTTNAEQAPARGRAATRWAKRLGVAGFLFFFIKGLAWIGVAAAASLGIATL